MNILRCYDIVILLLIIVYTMADHVTENQEDIEKEVTDSLTFQQLQDTTFEIPDEKLLLRAIKDISFYLRNYKFNEWDRRYFHDKPSDELVGFFSYFPSPPLRSLNWKVYGNCNENFYKCIIYLHSVIETAQLNRNTGSSIIVDESEVKDNNSVYNVNLECIKALLNAEKTGLPFNNPVERFQWSTSASYYMCWYTMLGNPELSMIGEPCNNFANYVELGQYGYHHSDIRSDDRFSFACAMYSFCPDPCCGKKYIQTREQCDNKANPCFIENADGELIKRKCVIDRKNNQNIRGIIENKWNVSCHCKESGFEWKSEFGMCVDINECVTGGHKCDLISEECWNLPNTYQCICKWGYAYDSKKRSCIKMEIIGKPTIDFDKKPKTFIEIFMSKVNTILNVLL